MNTRDYEDDIKFWKIEDVLKLANHFHHFTQEDESYQHIRVHQFEMEEEFVTTFTQFGTIDSMKICLALKSIEKQMNFTFYPILEITANGSSKKVHFPLEAKALDPDGSRSEFVPGIFKDMIQDNWNKIDITYIDDLFIAQEQDGNGDLLNQMIRVHSFLIDDEIVEFINELNREVPVNGDTDNTAPNIQDITLYPGVDMNKFGKKEYISFAPVLGFAHLTDSIQAHGRTGLIEKEKNETFIEYMFPCPPTCSR